MSVLTSIETESAFMGNLRGRRRDMVDMTETNLGESVQDFHWMVRTDLHLSQCQQNKQKKLPLGGHTSHIVCAPHRATGLFCCGPKAGRSHWYLENINVERDSALSFNYPEHCDTVFFFSFEKNKSSGRLFAKWRRLLPICCCRCRAAVSPGAFIHSAHSFP